MNLYTLESTGKTQYIYFYRFYSDGNNNRKERKEETNEDSEKRRPLPKSIQERLDIL